MANTNLTAERLKELLHYDHETGIFTWVANTSSRNVVGKIAGYISSIGYICIRINRELHYAHRLAWLYMTGRWPDNTIDHINADKSDTRYANLRDVLRKENYWNKKLPQRNNQSGFLGVSKENSKWQARIVQNGIKRRIGLFDTPEEAHQAYINAKRELHSSCTI